MRNIIFRGKRVEDGEWVYGYYIHDHRPSGGHIILSFDGYEQYAEEINPETLGQYTGAKDENGMMIFEGDDVIVNYGRARHIEKKGLTRQGVVVFDNKSCAFKVSIKDSAVLVGNLDIHRIKIIGNIHDKSPEEMED